MKWVIQENLFNERNYDDFVRISNMLELNGCPKEKEFLLEIDNWNDTLYNVRRKSED